MRTMYDSTKPQLIPVTAQIVAGYVTGRYAWRPADWTRFPHAAHVRIDTDGSQPFGSDVIDVERFDMTPMGAADWVRKRQSVKGWWSGAYVSLDNLPALRVAIGPLKCVYWVAEWNGNPHLISQPDIVAHQYKSTQPYDLSIVLDQWFPTEK